MAEGRSTRVVMLLAGAVVALVAIVWFFAASDDGDSDTDSAVETTENEAPTVEPAADPPAEEATATPTSPEEAPAALGGAHPIQAGTPCVLRLHGNNGSEGVEGPGAVNGPYYAGGEITLLDPISPTVTGQNTWWEFDGPYGTYSQDEQPYTEIAGFLTDYVDDFDCGPILVWGLSGGAAMAVELYCNGEDFGGRAWGYYFADPPLGESVLGCTPPSDPGIRTWFVQSQEFIDAATLYVAEGEAQCPEHEWGWYCEDGKAMTPETYYEHLGMEPLAVTGSHLEALLGGTPTEFNMWDQVETWWGDYDPSRF